ncbi:hypothetical protein I0C86_13785 [Plantactinospora sp. S1510]|uniref:Uncharacterized protein n=1 Tax=Plantactinospora alkalitolerans TaxID=2789879 RepID=A0ABS0GVB7_9ACTN|nr:hypothetical protein [Plantactinospora alkalitolerans]MBF9130021.1 hypothetical protein [Plantactinospora alkalitolerans]
MQVHVVVCWLGVQMAKRRNLWLAKQARPAVPPREKARGLVDITVDGVVRSIYVIVWDTPQGPVLYFVPLDRVPTVDWDHLVWQLCDRLLDREQWKRALLLYPVPIDLTAGDGDTDGGPRVRVHPVRFRTDSSGRLHLKRGDDHLVEQVARTLRAVLPVWLSGTEAVATAGAALSNPGRTLTVDDTTAWPGQEALLRLALQARFPELYPLGWAVLAVDGAAQLNEVVAGHARVPDRGEGWYLVARPQLPQPPEQLRQLLAEAVTPIELGERAVAEVAALRAAAAIIAGDDPRSTLYRGAAEKLASLTLQVQMAQFPQHRPRPSIVHPDPAKLITVTARWAGPVVQTWLRTLTPVVDLPAALRLQRGAELLRYTRRGERAPWPDFPSARPGEVREAYLDPAGRLVLVLSDPAGPDPTPWVCAEWPCDATVADGWTDDTVLAADRPVPGAAAGPLLALTPGVGNVRVDPFPVSPQYSGPLRLDLGIASNDGKALFWSVLKLALEQTTADVADRYSAADTHKPTAAEVADRHFVFETIVEDPGMTLWPAVMGARDSLRLRWDAVRAAAAADFARAQRLLAPDAPKIYRYYAIVPHKHSPIDKTRQVVRLSASPTGFAEEEQLNVTGGWVHGFIMDDIGRCKGSDSYRRLRLDEVDSHIAVVQSRWTRQKTVT